MMNSRARWKVRLLAALAVLAMIAVACGGGESSTTVDATTGTSATQGTSDSGDDVAAEAAADSGAESSGETVADQEPTEPTVTPIPAPTATPVPTAEPEPVVEEDPAGDASFSDDPDMDEALSELMGERLDLSTLNDVELAERETAIAAAIEEEDVPRPVAECIVDQLYQVTGSFDDDVDAADLDEDAFAEIMMVSFGCFMSVMFSPEVLVPVIAAPGYTRAEAECIYENVFEPLLASDASEDERAMAEAASVCADPVGPAPGSSAPGTNPALDPLFDQCAARVAAACADLVASFEAELGASGLEDMGMDIVLGCDEGDEDACAVIAETFETPYFQFGATCGGVSVLVGLDCGTILDGVPLNDFGGFDDGSADGPDFDFAAGPDTPPPGTDAVLDELWVQCGQGNAESCDTLYFDSAIDSEYEAFGLSCGGRELGWCEDVIAAEG